MDHEKFFNEQMKEAISNGKKSFEISKLQQSEQYLLQLHLSKLGYNSTINDESYEAERYCLMLDIVT